MNYLWNIKYERFSFKTIIIFPPKSNWLKYWGFARKTIQNNNKVMRRTTLYYITHPPNFCVNIIIKAHSESLMKNKKEMFERFVLITSNYYVLK